MRIWFGLFASNLTASMLVGVRLGLGVNVDVFVEVVVWVGEDVRVIVGVSELVWVVVFDGKGVGSKVSVDMGVGIDEGIFSGSNVAGLVSAG